MKQVYFLKTYEILLLGLSIFPFKSTSAQTCCSGGVPTSTNLGLPSSASKTLQLSFNYDLNTLNTQKAGTRRLDEPTSFRRTHTFMFQVGYGLTDRLAMDVFVPWIRQERRSNVNSSKEITNGLGDIILLFKYKLLALNNNETTFTLGFGTELPTGRTNFTNSFGGVLLADLQPGSGATDFILWGQYTQVLGFRKSMSFLLQSLYKINQQNSDYANNTITFQFGNEVQIISGLSDRLNIGKAIIDPALLFRFRKALQDKSRPNNIPQDLVNVPSTGGVWLFINPSFTYWISPDWSANFNVELPIYANITGTQVTPTYRFNFGMFYRLSSKNKSLNIMEGAGKGTF